VEIFLEKHGPSDPEVVVRNRLDLGSLIPRIKRSVGGRHLSGYARGKRQLARAIHRSMGLSTSRAAHLVDRLEEEGAIRYVRPSGRWGRKGRKKGRKRWSFTSAPSTSAPSTRPPSGRARSAEAPSAK
jgi:hypothetical protein